MRTSFDIACRVEVELSDERCVADVELDGDYPIGPGDRVRVHGDPIALGFGERASFRRMATVQPAGALRRAWTRLAGHFELTELYEVSFSSGRIA